MTHRSMIAWALVLALSVAFGPRVCWAHRDSVHTRNELPTGLQLQTDRGVLTVEPWKDGIIHVRFGTPGYAGNYNPAVIAKPASVEFHTAETAEAYLLSTTRLTVRINKAEATIAFLLPDGTPLLEEAERDAGLGASLSFKTTTALYGLGQHQNGLLDYSGHSIHLQQANTEVAVPMMVSPDGWGLLWNDASVTDVDVAVPGAPHPLTIRSEAGPGVDYDFIFGPAMDDVIRGYRWLTGDAPMMARWTWGMWQSKERYQTQSELISIPARYRRMGIPIDAVIQDWQYWPANQWGSHRFDTSRYPDPAKMVADIHDLHVHTIISVWPRFDLATDNLAQLNSAHAAFEDTFNNVYPPGLGRWYDPWNARGRELYWSQIQHNLGVLGFDGWWLDADEAELGGVWGEMREQATAAGPGIAVTNSFPLMHTTAVHDGMRRDQPDKRVFILSRSAYAGQQRNAAITWSGDIRGNWETLRRQIPAALNFSLSGIPYWSNDIGGFFPQDGMSDADYAELFTRWHQFGVFNPMFRIHGTGRAKELWSFDPATQNRLKQDIELRYRLLPYLYSTSWAVYSQQKSLMRALVFDFRDDTKAREVTDEYLFGDAFLVAPVLEPGAKTRHVYLPGSDLWFDFWSGHSSRGGQQIESTVDDSHIPVFVRAGSIVPLGPVRPYADAPSEEPLELRVYPGRDARFTLYDDAGDGYGYQRGEKSTIDVQWVDRHRRLRIGARQGSYPGMPGTLPIKVVCATAADSAAQLINYDGRAREVRLQSCVAHLSGAHPVALAAQNKPNWTIPIAPFRIADGLYYVGSKDLASYLVVTSQGNILINPGLESSPTLIRNSIEQLGLNYADTRILLISHAHWDHDAGSARVIQETGAKYMVMDDDVPVVESGGALDFAYATRPYPKAKVDRVLHDGDEVKLGDAALVAHKTPGHTRGCTTWTMKTKENNETRDAVIVGSWNVNAGYRLVDTDQYPASYPGIADDYRKTFALLKTLPCEIFLGAHGDYFNLLPKLARTRTAGASVWIDPDGYQAKLAEREKVFEAKLRRQQR